MNFLFEKRLLNLKPQDIVSSNLVQRQNIDEYELSLLADSISVNGIIEPLTVRKNLGGKYEIISGERRLRAAIIAGLRRVPCVVYKPDNPTAAVYSVCQNIQTVKLSFYEEAKAIKSIIKEYGISEGEAAIRLGISRSAVIRKLSLLKLEPVLIERIVSSGLGEGFARQLMRLGADKRTDTLDYIIAEGLTLRQTEEHIGSILKKELKGVFYEKKEQKPFRKASIGDERFFENSLNKLMSTLEGGGFDVSLKKNENSKFKEYKVRIKRQPEAKPQSSQMGVVGL